jgi:iron complex outermembrane receptor protein
MEHLDFRSPKRFFIGILTSALLTFLVLPSLAQEGSQKEKEKEKIVKITEEILVVGKAPKDQPVSTVTRIDFTKIEQNKPKDLSEAIRYAPGVTVTFGDKDVYTLKLRGMDSKRIALLIDGVPDYEPYYSTFDLKTISAAGLDSIQITKGPSSVLYGPNTLGGIVNVITRRPGSEPFLTLNGSYGEKNTRNIGLDGGARWNKFSVVGNFYYQDSDGFYYPDPTNGKTGRTNSDYRRLNLNAKLYYAPSSTTEIMVNGGIYTSDYGMPAALGVQKARYWKFKDWDRTTLNAGGYTALGKKSTLRFRTFFVEYKNTLDQYTNPAMSIRQFESTFDNSVYGVFGLADLALASWNALKLSVNYENDTARTQDDLNYPWQKYNQGTFSAAIEDHISLFDQWKLIGGFSLDYLNKISGENRTKLNPLIGLKFTPRENLDLHISVSQKSKFPSMRSMYSASSGNPDLLSETGTNAEVGFTFNQGIYLSGAAFICRFKDLIDTYRLPDGTRRYFNIGKSHINGFEIQAQKFLGWVEATLNYTYLDHENDSDHRPLDAISGHNLNFVASFFPLKSLRIGFYGLYASASRWFDVLANTNFDIPSYFNLDLIASYEFSRFEIFVKATNMFDDYIYSEPIFPWRARFFEVGAKIKVL